MAKNQDVGGLVVVYTKPWFLARENSRCPAQASQLGVALFNLLVDSRPPRSLLTLDHRGGPDATELLDEVPQRATVTSTLLRPA